MGGEKPGSDEALKVAQQFSAEGADIENESDPETAGEIQTLTDADTLLQDGIDNGDPDKISGAIKLIEEAPDTLTTPRQRDSEEVKAAKLSFKGLLTELTSLDTWVPPQLRDKLSEFSGDVSEAMKLLANESDNSFATDLGRVVGTFYQKHGVGAAISALQRTDRQ